MQIRFARPGSRFWSQRLHNFLARLGGERWRRECAIALACITSSWHLWNRQWPSPLRKERFKAGKTLTESNGVWSLEFGVFQLWMMLESMSRKGGREVTLE